MTRGFARTKSTPRPWQAICLIVLLGAWPALASPLLTLRFEDDTGAPIPVRAHVTDGAGNAIPGSPDPTLLTHSDLGGFFYADGSVSLSVPAGPVHVTAGRGFEWRSTVRDVVVSGDTTIVIPLVRAFDLRALGWYSGDTHVHTRHYPLDYTVLPADLHRVARAEDLAMTWSLDQDWAFTGEPHPISDADATIYYSTEYRNHVYGHAALLGLDHLMDVSCCWPSVAASPTISDLVDSWSPGFGAGLVLAHPHNTPTFWDDFETESGWPYNGMGRGLPVVAARGRLAALDIAAYTNDPDVYLADWYDLLNCGLHVPASAGTDAAVNAYGSRPAGGVRVYVAEPSGHTWSNWVEGLKQGRSVVTNYPLLVDFEVDGVAMGGTLDLAAPRTVSLSVDVGCTEPLTWAIVIRNGIPVATIPLSNVEPGTWTHVDVTLPISEGSWLAVRVYGNAATSHPVNPSLFAHTSPVYVRVAGEGTGRTESAGRLVDWVDRLGDFVEDRGNWASTGQRASVLGQLAQAKQTYLALFREPPGAFALRHPTEGAVFPPRQPMRFDWDDAVDPEPGDVVQYTVTISADSTFHGPTTLRFFESQSRLQLPDWLLPAGYRYWWRVVAVDRAGHPIEATGSPRHFDINPVSVDTPAALAEVNAPRVWPNPTPRGVLLDVPGANDDVRIRIVDVQGRTRLDGIATTTPGLRHVGPHLFNWDGRDANGHRLASGRYWVTFDGVDVHTTLPVTLLR